jgi:hypothetical protein
MSIRDVVFLGIAVILLLMAVGFPLVATSNLNSVVGITTSPNLRSAQQYLRWSGYIAIISLILVLILLGVSFFTHLDSGHAKLIGIIVVALVLFMTLISAFLVIMAQSSLSTNPTVSSVGAMGSARRLALIATMINVILFILLLVYLIVLLLHHPTHSSSTPAGTIILTPLVQQAANQAATQTLAQATAHGQPTNVGTAQAQIAATAAATTLSSLQSHGATPAQMQAVQPQVVSAASQVAAAGGNLNQTLGATQVAAQQALTPSPVTSTPGTGATVAQLPQVTLPPPTIPAGPAPVTVPAALTSPTPITAPAPIIAPSLHADGLTYQSYHYDEPPSYYPVERRRINRRQDQSHSRDDLSRDDFE